MLIRKRPHFRIVNRNRNFLIVLLAVILAIILGIEINNNSKLQSKLDLQNTQATSDNSASQSKIGNLNNQLSESKTNYDNLKQAVLNDDSHAQEIGHRLQISCVPSSPLYIKPVNPSNLTPDQLYARCGQAVDDVFIDDYIQQNGNIQ